MPYRRVLAALFATALCPLAASAATVRIADGDVAALQAAFANAPASGETLRVVLSTRGSYRLDRGLQLARGRVELDGSGATLYPSDRAEPGLLRVGAEAALRVQGLNVRGETGRRYGQLLRMEGELTLDAVSIADAEGLLRQSEQPMFDIAAGSTAQFRNVTLAQLDTPCTRIGRGCQSTYPVFGIAGDLAIEHGTVLGVNSWAVAGIHVLGGSLRVRNSLFDGDSLACASNEYSQGGNAFDDPACAGPVDAVLPFSWERPQEAQLGDLAPRGGLAATIAPPAHHPARGVGRDCLSTDARGALRPAQGCTPGAYELDAQLGDNRLIGGKGGAGVWFDPSNDGHYLQIQPLNEDERLLTWMHFDADGNPAWAYLVVEADAERLAGDAYRNRAQAPQGGVHGGAAEPWGRLEALFESCDTLRLRYASDAHGPGIGEVVLKRLTGLPELGCQ